MTATGFAFHTGKRLSLGAGSIYGSTDYGQQRSWHDLSWWGARDPTFIQQSHPQWTFALQQAIIQ
jgi:phosphoglycerol transferase MdoB-like AlkP superfamily enzyme